MSSCLGGWYFYERMNGWKRNKGWNFNFYNSCKRERKCFQSYSTFYNSKLRIEKYVKFANISFLCTCHTQTTLHSENFLNENVGFFSRVN